MQLRRVKLTFAVRDRGREIARCDSPEIESVHVADLGVVVVDSADCCSFIVGLQVSVPDIRMKVGGSFGLACSLTIFKIGTKYRSYRALRSGIIF